MESGSHKLYHIDGMDSRQCLDHYFSDNPDMVFEEESLKFPLDKFHQVFSQGHIKGDVLVDISIGPIVHHLYSACGYFKDIYLLKFTERCSMEVNKWLHTRTGAFDWKHASAYVTQLEGTSDTYEDKEMRLKEAIRQIVKCDIEKENMTGPMLLPPADCVISVLLLEAISKDQEDYVRNLRKMAKFLKAGGHLMLVGVLNTTYFTIGQDRFHAFKSNEDFVKRVLTGEGFIIDHCDVLRRKSVSDLIDHNAVLFIAAHKEK